MLFCEELHIFGILLYKKLQLLSFETQAAILIHDNKAMIVTFRVFIMSSRLPSSSLILGLCG